jgi:hypothetical protein
VCMLEEATGGLVRAGEGPVGGQFHKRNLIVSNAS